ncbi:MAG: hypothetical protein H7A55_07350 [Verrucomicrobiaceae bacterium]|nr:hypothetical protein [Verrucomicrobiaceae bacterium]
MNNPFLIFAAVLALGAAHTFAQASKATQSMHQEGKIRLFYYTTGQQAVDPLDANQNQIPDQVEDVLLQTQAAQTLWIDVLGFPDPFQTERFHSASFLDIHFRHKDVLKANGVTYDELQHFNKPGDPKDTVSICFNVATSVKAPANLTPAHEFFHLVQNSTTYFKNRWFTEGTARWSERGLGTGALGPAKVLSAWPLPESERAALFQRTYDASEHFWNPLAKAHGTNDSLPPGSALERLQAMRYTDGSPVLKDLQLTGWRLIRNVITELAQGDDEAFKELGYDRWSEDNQKSPQNDAFIMKAIERAMAKMP